MDDNRKDSIGEEASAFGQRAKGDIKEATGTVTGDSSMRADGASESATGAARQQSNRMVTGLFRDRDSAERAYGSLSTRGYSKDDVNLLMSDETRKTHFSSDDAGDTDLGSKALEGAGAGAAIGGTTGAVLAAIAAIGTSVVLPGLGLIVAGPLAAALAGAGAGGATGGLIGALIGSGIPEDRAKQYESGVKEGGIVMGVNARSDEDAEYFENEFRTHRGENVYR
ncbi:MAG TPA: CsbD family protein [Pyrinomonadaceae bacterium]|nr:CsbD family protein [Pyrinomonadaceae bacterium]